MTEMDPLADPDEPSDTDIPSNSVINTSSSKIIRNVSLERNDGSISESLETNENHEKSNYNGNFYQWKFMNNNSNNAPTDPWVPQTKGSRSKYFCVKNEPSLDSSPKNELNFYPKSNLSYGPIFPTPNGSNNSKTKSATIFCHFRKFCETTSLRGVPRIIHSKKKRFRWLWIIFVVVFFIGCMTCSFLLIKQYRAYDVIHQPKTSYNDPSDFPSVTFCNLRPFSSKAIDVLKKSGIKSLSQFISTLRKNVNNTFSVLTNLSQTDKTLYSVAWSLDVFLMNLPDSINLESIGHSKSSMIIKCNLHYRKGSESISIPCKSGGEWILTKNELFLNCYTYTLFEKYLKTVQTVDLILHLDDNLQFSCQDCNHYLAPSQMTGIRFSLHTAHTFPDVISEGQNLSPGTLTDAVFHTKQWNMMEPPYGKCSKSIQSYYEFQEGKFLYSLKGCQKHTIQKLLHDSCNCIQYYNIPKIYSALNRSENVCNFVQLSIFQNNSKKYLDFDTIEPFLNRTRCKKEISHQFLDDYKTCTVPCQYYTFDVKISSGIYPTKSYHLDFSKSIQAFLRREIRNSSLKDEEKDELNSILNKFKIYNEISDMVEKGKTKEAEKLLKNTDIIERNFLTIQIGRQDFTIIKVEEKEVVTITSLLSQTGGMLSIWSGVTFFCLVEFIELLMNIFDTVFSFQS